MDGMLTLKEVMDFLELGQPEVESLVKKGRLNAFKIGGTYLRFRKDQVVEVKANLARRGRARVYWAKASNYWYFNRIYILSAVLLGLVIYCILIQ